MGTRLGYWGVETVLLFAVWLLFVDQLQAHELLAGAAASAVAAAATEAVRGTEHPRFPFSTISHMGVLLLGVALLTPAALGGVALYVVAHAMLKGGLFLAAGIVLHRAGTLDEIELIACRRTLRPTGVLFFIGAAGLAGIPPFGTFWGELMMGGSAQRLGYGWMEPVAFFAAA
jgi:multicomponent Na+:H+ antiporter subunit D